MSEEELKTELDAFVAKTLLSKRGRPRHPFEGQRKGSSLDLRHEALSRDLV